METNLGSALFTASISVVIGGGVSYLLYVKTIGKWYAKNRSESKHAKIKYWCGILSLLTITQGVITIANELITSLINNVAINVDNLARGVVVVIIYPILFAVIAYALSFFIKEKANKEKEEIEEASKPQIKKENTNKNNLNIVIFLAFAVVVLLAIQVAPYLKTNEKEKTFQVESCVSCNDDGCKPHTTYTKIHVSPPFVYIHYISDGVEKININPENVSDSCLINKENNFSFTCEKIRNYGITKMEISNSFDGKNSYRGVTKATFGQQVITTKNICQIK